MRGSARWRRPNPARGRSRSSGRGAAAGTRATCHIRTTATQISWASSMQSCVIGLQDSMGRRRSRHCTRVRVWVILSGLRVAVGRLGEHNLRRLAPARLVARMDPEAHRRARWQEIHGARSLRRLAILDGRPRRPAVNGVLYPVRRRLGRRLPHIPILAAVGADERASRARLGPSELHASHVLVLAEQRHRLHVDRRLDGGGWRREHLQVGLLRAVGEVVVARRHVGEVALRQARSRGWQRTSDKREQRRRRGAAGAIWVAKIWYRLELDEAEVDRRLGRVELLAIVARLVVVLVPRVAAGLLRQRKLLRERKLVACPRHTAPTAQGWRTPNQSQGAHSTGMQHPGPSPVTRQSNAGQSVALCITVGIAELGTWTAKICVGRRLRVPLPLHIKHGRLRRRQWHVHAGIGDLDDVVAVLVVGALAVVVAVVVRVVVAGPLDVHVVGRSHDEVDRVVVVLGRGVRLHDVTALALYIEVDDVGVVRQRLRPALN
mmetsp:Transcript_50269/g.132674  ORF Transcript_50269/g.132674 Transcript_50269/m.132674 type:complete len:491 (-) Transcript_50269:1474-2946(-)